MIGLSQGPAAGWQSARRRTGMAAGGIFRVSEIVQMAIDEEHNGCFFYNALAECADSEALRKLATVLAAQELGHEKAFTDLRDRLGAHQPHETYPGEYADYVGVLVAGRTFPDEQGAEKRSDPEIEGWPLAHDDSSTVDIPITEVADIAYEVSCLLHEMV